jgi:hypothetical protein
MTTAKRGLSLAEALLEIAPRRRRELWQRLAFGLHRAQPGIAIAGFSTPVPVQLIRRVDLVTVAAPVSRVARAMVRLYCEFVAELFRRGAAGEIGATYHDNGAARGRVPVSLEHWRGGPRSKLASVFMLDMGEGQGLDRGYFFEPGAELYVLEPADASLDPDRNALLPWHGLILPDIEVTVNPAPSPGNPYRPGTIAAKFTAWLNQRGSAALAASDQGLARQWVTAGRPGTVNNLRGVAAKWRERQPKG